MLVTPLNFVGNKLWSFRAASEAPDGRASSRVGARRSRFAVVGCGAATTRRRPDRPASTTRRATSSQTPFAPAPEHRRLTEQRARRRIFLARPEGRRTGWTATRANGRTTDATSTSDSASGRVKVWSGAAGEIATGKVDDPTGAVDRGVDRAAGGVEDGARLRRRVRRREDQQLPGLARLLRCSSCSGSPTCAGRSRCATSTCSCCSRSRSRSGSSTAATSSRACRSPTRRCSTCSARMRLDRRGAAGSRTALGPVWPVWLLAAATVFLTGFRIGLNVAHVERDRRRLRGRDRRRPDRRTAESPYGHFPVEDTLKACGPADSRRRDPRADPDERPLRVGRTRAATPTGRSPTRRTSRATSLFGWTGQVGRPAGRALHRRSRSTCSACSALALVGWRFGGQRLGGDARVRVGGVSRSRSTPRARTRTTRSCRRS